METFLTIIIALVVISSLFKKKKKDEATFPSQQINEQEERSPFYTELDVIEKPNLQKYNEVVNKVEKIKNDKNNVKAPTIKKKFDIKSAMIYSAIMERPYEY